MDDYLATGSPQKAAAEADEHVQYQLYGVVNHIGTYLTFGHCKFVIVY